SSTPSGTVGLTSRRWPTSRNVAGSDDHASLAGPLTPRICDNRDGGVSEDEIPRGDYPVRERLYLDCPAEPVVFQPAPDPPDKRTGEEPEPSLFAPHSGHGSA